MCSTAVINSKVKFPFVQQHTTRPVYNTDTRRLHAVVARQLFLRTKTGYSKSSCTLNNRNSLVFSSLTFLHIILREWGLFKTKRFNPVDSKSCHSRRFLYRTATG